MQHDIDGIKFNVKFDEGYVIRKLIDFLKASYSKGEFIFTSEGLYGQASNENMCSYFVMSKNSIPNYSFHSPEGKACRFGIDFMTMIRHVKLVTKKKTITFFKDADSDLLMVRCDDDGPSATWIASRNEIEEYSFEPGTLTVDPVCCVHSKLYKETLSRPSELKYASSLIEVYKQHIVLNSSADTNTDGLAARLGREPENEVEEKPVVKMAIDSRILKNTAKMADIGAANGILKLWGQGFTQTGVESGSRIINPLLKVQASIGLYGEIRTYIFGDNITV